VRQLDPDKVETLRDKSNHTCLAGEWHHMVLTEAKYVDIAYNHHFIVVLFEHSVVDDI
jgi:hypothetical protein